MFCLDYKTGLGITGLAYLPYNLSFCLDYKTGLGITPALGMLALSIGFALITKLG